MKMDHRLLNLVRNRKKLFLPSIIFGWFSGLAIIGQAWLLSDIIDKNFLQRLTLSDLWNELISLLVVVSLRFLFAYIGKYYSIKLSYVIKNSLRRDLLHKFIRVNPLRTLSEKKGDLLTTMLNRVDLLDNFFSEYLPQLVLALAIPLTILLFVFSIDLLSFIVFLVTAPLIPVFMILIGMWAEIVIHRQWTVFSRLSQFYVDLLKGLANLKIFTESRRRYRHIKKMTNEFRLSSMQVLKVAFLSSLSLELLATLSTAVIAVEIGVRLLYDLIEFQETFFILLLAPDFYFPLRNLASHYHDAQNSQEAAKKIFSYLEDRDDDLNTREEIKKQENDRRNTASLPQAPVHSIHLSNISYRYPESGKLALNDVSLNFEAGKKYAILGQSGSGKSTLLNLFLSLIHPLQGSIQVIHRDKTRSDFLSPEPHFSFLNQNPYFFPGTIRENLGIARMAEIADVHMERALKAFFLLDELSSYQRFKSADQKKELTRCEIRNSPVSVLDIRLGDRGQRLSSGQLQRLALARISLQERDWLFMDEATNHLDLNLEQKVMRSMQNVFQRKTWIMITHRVELVKFFDYVFYLHEGKLLYGGNSKDFMKAYRSELSTAGEGSLYV